MTTVTLAIDESDAAVARVRALLDRTAMRDPSWNGASFVIERGDWTSIDDDSEDACELFSAVKDALRGE